MSASEVSSTEGPSHLDTGDKHETSPRIVMLMGELEALLLTIKEEAIPVLTNRDPTLEAWRARRFLRLADRMLEDMHDLLVSS